jgi:stage II sporulation protein D
MDLVLQSETRVMPLLSQPKLKPAGLRSRLPGMGSVSLEPLKVSGRVLWAVIDKTSGQVLTRVLGESIELRGEMMRIDLKPAPGLVILKAEAAHGVPTVDVIAAMDLETYLAGVLPQEMPPDWPVQALKAQAIASRSFALNRIRERRGRAFHVESTVMDQAFTWQEPSVERTQKHALVDQALKETRGLVLSDSRGAILTAYFHADCGGRTEHAGAVWGGRVRTAGTAIDGGCPFSPKARWTWSVTREELSARLRPMLGLSVGASIRDISLEKLSKSGRVLALTLATDDGQVRKLSGHELRSVLGFDRLKSTAFEIQNSPDGGFRFQGRGHGHGVGMCQWGSRKLAASGADYQRILKHYYPKASLVRLADGEFKGSSTL